MQFKPNLVTAAELMECGETTLKNFIKRKFEETYTEYSNRKLSTVRIKLVQKAIQMAMSGNNNVMLIFCLKNICKWSDNVEPDLEESDLEFL